MLSSKQGRVCLLGGALLLVGRAPAHAFITDDAIAAMMYAEEQAYHAFMKIQVIQEIATLKQNYDASVRYYQQFKQLNSGRGFAQNVAAQIKTSQKQEDQSIWNQIDQTFIHTYNTNTAVDQFYKALDQGIVNNIRYAGNEFSNLISNRQNGQNIAANADGLAPKDAANLSAKAQGIQVQMLTQIHEDNLRMIQLQSMQLATQARREQGDATSIDDIQQSLQNRFPNTQVQPTAGEGQ